LKLNTAYLTFNGEQNAFGIGSPAIFLRLQGCHLRCYNKTLGILCDTPEGLEKSVEKDEISFIFAKVSELSKISGVKLITLTGGDPLWNKEDELKELLTKLTDDGYSISIETSGTISWLPYSQISKNIFWVLDYKLKSCGVKNADKLFKDTEHLEDLSEADFIKFVVYDDIDLDEAITAINNIKDKTLANITIGAYWGGKIEPFSIFDRVKNEGLLNRVVMNFQVHKLTLSPNYLIDIPKEI